MVYGGMVGRRVLMAARFINERYEGWRRPKDVVGGEGI
jgi:hypothetical protein